MAVRKQIPHTEVSSIRWRPEDWKRIEQLRKKTGIRTVTELVRAALGALAAKEGVQ
jgi:hypothetical protein